MRKFVSAKHCIAFAAVAMLSLVADACTAFVVGKKASATGHVIVGHNNDGFGPMRYAILHATDSAPALVEQGRTGGLGGGKSTALYWQAVYSDKAKVGKATGDVLLNEHGVIMFSNSGGFMHEWGGRRSELPDEAAAAVVDGGLGLSLRFEVVRRAKSAAEGVKIATALIDKYGYGPDARTFTIADRDEAWILCAVRGRRYVARRCPDDAVMAYPNILPVGRILPDDIVSPGIAEKRETLDFAAAYQGVRTKHDLSQKYRILEFYRTAAGVDVDENELPWSVRPARLVGVDDLKRGFSSHATGHGRESVHPEEVPGVAWPICRLKTLESVVCRFADNPADTHISLAAGRPCETKYDEFRPFKDAPPSYFATGAEAEALLAGRLGKKESAGPLSPGGWNPVTRERLNALIEKNRGKPDAYAVFDFDYTTAIGDLSYVCMWELFENFDIKVDDFLALISKDLDEKYMDDVNEIGALAAKLKPLAGRNLVDNPVWRKFVSRYWQFYRRLYVDVGDYTAYLWRSRVFAGYAPAELRDLAKRGVAKAVRQGCLRRDPNAPTEKRGIVFTPEIKELFRELRKAGIAVYLVSGSFQEALFAATGPDFGLDLDPACVFGADFKKDAEGRYLPEMVEGCVKSGEKPSFILANIAPRHHGAEPILTAGDSVGDYKMLTEFKDLQLALLFFRRWRDPEMNELAARGGRVVLQGRDETRGCYIPEILCIEPPLPPNN